MDEDLITSDSAPEIVAPKQLTAEGQLSNMIGFVLDPQWPIVLLPAKDELRSGGVLPGSVGYKQVLGYLAESIRSRKQAGMHVTSSDM